MKNNKNLTINHKELFKAFIQKIKEVCSLIDVNNFAYMKISLASPEKIRSWSYGEVKNLKLLTIEL